MTEQDDKSNGSDYRREPGYWKGVRAGVGGRGGESGAGGAKYGGAGKTCGGAARGGKGSVRGRDGFGERGIDSRGDGEGGERVWAHRYSGEQRGHYQRRAGGAHEERRLGCGAGDEPDRSVSGDSAGAAGYDARALGADYKHFFGGGRIGQRGPGELFGLEGGADRLDEIAGARDGQPQHYGERGGAGIHRNGHDGRAERGDERENRGIDSVEARRAGGGGGGGGAIPGERGGGIHHRARFGRERRDVHVGCENSRDGARRKIHDRIGADELFGGHAGKPG